MEFPMLVYKDGGPHQRPGGTFDYVCVGDEEQRRSRLAEGWFMTVGEAVAPKARPAPTPAPIPPAPPPPDDAPPTRAEIEQKLRELGVSFHPNTGDAKLAAKLDEALKGQP